MEEILDDTLDDTLDNTEAQDSSSEDTEETVSISKRRKTPPSATYYIGTGDKLPSRYDNRLPFGLPYLDYVIGGGIRRGCISIISGDAYSGKSTMALGLAANASNPVYIDSEGTLDREIMELRGVLHAHVYQPPDLQSMMCIAEEHIGEEHDLIVMDSPSLCYPSAFDNSKSGVASLKGTAGDEPPLGIGSRYFNNFIRRVNALLRQNQHTALVIIQHTRTDLAIGSYGPPKKVLALGREQLFAADLHIRCSGEQIKYAVPSPGGENKTTKKYVAVALRCHWAIEKIRGSQNSIGSGSFVIGLVDWDPYEAGKIYIDDERIRYLSAIGAIVPSGAYYDTPLGRVHGRAALREMLCEQWDEIIEKLNVSQEESE